jgi:hypothetical protein
MSIRTLACFALAVLGASCQRAPAGLLAAVPGQPRTGSASLLAYVPPDVDLVVGIDWRKVLSSPVAPIVNALLGRIRGEPKIGRILKRLSLDVRAVEALVFAIRGREGLLLARGRFDRSALESFVRERPIAGVSLRFLADDILALAQRDFSPQVLALFHGVAPRKAPPPFFPDLFARTDVGATAFAVGRLPPRFVGMLWRLRMIRALRLPAPPIALGGSLDIGVDLDLRLLAAFSGPEVAAAWQEKVDGLLLRVRAYFEEARLPGPVRTLIQKALGSVRLKATGKRLEITAHLEQGGNLLGLAGAAAGILRK